jgi:cyclic dehypoxanthinyl futalosine synthase
MARKDGLSITDVLTALKNAGIDTLPGGGAEVLTPSVRQRLSPNKCTCEEWLSVMRTAHGLGFRTTATLMYGHIETNADIVDHLLGLRQLQDETGRFSSFIPWSFKPGRSDLSRRVTSSSHPAQYIRVIALARLLLDNVAHIQSSWFSESTSAGQLGLLAGADDFGGILMEENVLRQTGYEKTSTLEDVCQLIRQAGFRPARRDSNYRIVEEY